MPMRRGCAAVARSWWSRVAMTRHSRVWRFCDACTRSICMSGPRAGGRRAGPALTPPRSAAAPPRRSQEQPRATPRVADQGAHTRPIAGHEAVTIPVVEEDLVIGTQEVERGTVRIYSRVTAQPVEEAVRLREERITVERRPADRPATAADIAAAAQEVIELTETVEEPVVSKRARVVEEVVVQKEVTEHTETVRGTARHTEVEVQRAPRTPRQPGGRRLPKTSPPTTPPSGSTTPQRLLPVGRRMRSMSPRTAMAMS